jgi:PPOX class probable FMN-dependent enzyme
VKKIERINQLRALYPSPKERAVQKQLSGLDKHSTLFINTSPFAVISTFDNKGNMDTSPRGGEKGFIRILDEKTLLIPDAKGNNRLDSLENIVDTGRIGMLFLVPGIDETLRLNGRACLSTDHNLLEKCDNQRIPPKVVIVVTIEEVFLHCAKALMRSQLWSVASIVAPDMFPTMGQMLKDQIGDHSVPESRAAMQERYKKDL